ncbi:MAG: acyltransferase [Pseudomonadota bacterium]
MSEPLSIYLNALRVFAAMIVLVCHSAFLHFGETDLRSFIHHHDYASDAVMVFFVLSGFLIAHTAAKSNWRTYAFDRYTRILSVAAPAVLLTLVFDRIGLFWAPEAYQTRWFSPASVEAHVFAALTFTSEWSFVSKTIGSNFPLWSLSYEAAYYVAFGLMMFTSGLARIAFVGVFALLAGVEALLLAPAWFMGAALYRLARTNQRLSAAHVILVIAPIPLYFLFLESGVRQMLGALGDQLVLETIGRHVRFSDEYLWDLIVALLFAAHLFGAAILASRLGSPALRVKSVVNWLAGGTFSLYVVHFPVLMLANAFLFDHPEGFEKWAMLVGAAILVSYAFAWAFERRLVGFRALIKGLSLRPTSPASTP